MNKITKFPQIIYTSLLIFVGTLVVNGIPFQNASARTEVIKCATGVDFEEVRADFLCSEQRNIGNKISFLNKDKKPKKVTLKVIKNEIVQFPPNIKVSEFTVAPNKKTEIQLEDKPTEVEIQIDRK